MQPRRSPRVLTPFRLIAAAAFALLPLGFDAWTLRADPAIPPTNGAATPATTPLAEAKAALKSLYEIHSRAVAAAATETEFAKASSDLHEAKTKLARRTTELAAGSPSGAETAELLAFVLSDLPDTDAALECAKLLAKDHPARAERVAFAVAVQPQVWSEEFLRDLAASPNLASNRRLPVALCQCMHQRSLLFLRDEATRPFPEAVELLKTGRGEEFVQWLQSLDGEALANDTIARFEKLRADSGDKKIGGPTIAEHADASIRAIRKFRLGMPASPIEGKDLAGDPLRLEDSRGKVVLVTFWASWCAPCIAEMTRERDLLRRFGGEDFAILGVCLDENLETARKTVADAGVTWKSFADRDHSIAEEWFAMQLPTCAVIDREGVLQARGVPLERAEKIFERLLRDEREDAGSD